MSQRFAVNCSILFKDLPIPERLERVRDAGGTAVEFWWPFASGEPEAGEVEAFVGAIQASGLQLVGLNLFAGDMGAGDRGVLSHPDRRSELVASAEIAGVIAARTGCTIFNALYGNRITGQTDAEARDVAVSGLVDITRVLGPDMGTIVVEAVSGAPDYPLTTAALVIDLLRRARGAGAKNTAMLLDFYHLAVNGDDVDAVLRDHIQDIAHVQIADAPGRGAPGTGELPLARWLDALAASTYPGHVALEFTAPDAEASVNLRKVAWS